MSESERDTTPPGDIDWQSPRWREADENQADAEREHRFHDDEAPTEGGAIDRDGSVDRGPRPPRQSPR